MLMMQGFRLVKRPEVKVDQMCRGDTALNRTQILKCVLYKTKRLRSQVSKKRGNVTFNINIMQYKHAKELILC